MQIKTKNQLLDEIKKCREKINKGKLFFMDDKEKLQAFNEGTKSIEQLFVYDTLLDRKFPDLPSLRFDEGFENFLVNCKKAEDIKKRLDDIAHDLEVCGKIYSENATILKLNNINELQESALSECESAINGSLEYQIKKAGKKYLLFKFGVVGLICVAIVFTVLSLFEPFKDWGAIVGALIGALDFCFGLGFQIYERNDDIAQKSKTQAAQSKLQDKRKQINDKKQTIDVSVVQNAEKIANLNQYGTGNTQNLYI